VTNLGNAYWQQGRSEQAADHHQQALAMFREIGDRSGEAKALNGVGQTHRATGQLHEAQIQHTTALTLATLIGDRYELARAHNGLAHTHYATGDLDQARHHWHEALALYAHLGVPDADDVRAHLTALHLAVDDEELPGTRDSPIRR
jgi:tetratricopeptide (TPR) repeat protein